MRKARFRLWRLSPPFTRAVEVHRITVGGFLDLVRLVAPKVAAQMVAAGRGLSDQEFIRSAADAETVSAAADLLLVDQPVGMLHGWLHGRLGGAFAKGNTRRLLDASRAVEGEGQWTRFLGCINRPAAQEGAGAPKSKERGGMGADVDFVAARLGLPPPDVEAWELQSFLNFCDRITARLDSEDGAAADADEPVPISDLEGLGSGAVFH